MKSLPPRPSFFCVWVTSPTGSDLKGRAFFFSSFVCLSNVCYLKELLRLCIPVFNMGWRCSAQSQKRHPAEHQEPVSFHTSPFTLFAIPITFPSNLFYLTPTPTVITPYLLTRPIHNSWIYRKKSVSLLEQKLGRVRVCGSLSSLSYDGSLQTQLS